jgi:GT2 family glycosyltransferase
MIVIIPYRSNAYDLGVLLTQLQMQTVLPEAIYLADNSEDGSGVHIAERYQWSVPIATQKKVGGIHQSWNAGLRYAGEKDVVILNDDIMISNDFISIMGDYMKTDVADMYCPANSGFPPTGKIRKGYTWNAKSELSYYFLDHEQYILPPSIAGWCMGIPYHTRKKIGMFNEDFTLYFGDKDYEKRIFTADGQVCFIKGMFVQHFGSSSTIKIESKDHSDIYKHDESIYKKKWGIV